MFDELLSPLLETVWGRRAGIIALVVMAGLLCISFVSMVLSWHSDMKILHAKTNIQMHMQSDHDVGNRIRQIPTWHLFGASDVVDQSETLPITSLQLRLLGVIKAVPEGLSKVIISESGQPGKVYKMDDTLSSGVKVHAITSDGVVFENGGRLEKLLLQRSPLLFNGMPKPLLEESNP